MNFDELKNKWDKQSADELTIKNNLEDHKEVHSIIDKVRSVMKKDFFFQVTTFPLMLIYPFVFNMSTPLIWFVMFCYIVIMTIPFYVLVKFYRSSYKLEYNSLKNLNWFYYNYKFSIDVFSIYSYIMYILIMMFVGIVFFERQDLDNSTESTRLLLVFVVFIVVYSAFCVWMTKWWIKKFYAKPLAQIKQILDDLED